MKKKDKIFYLSFGLLLFTIFGYFLIGGFLIVISFFLSISFAWAYTGYDKKSKTKNIISWIIIILGCLIIFLSVLGYLISSL